MKLLNVANYLYDHRKWRDLEIYMYESHISNSIDTVNIWQGEIQETPERKDHYIEL